MNSLPPELLQAYKNTIFSIFPDNTKLSFKVDSHSEELSKFMRKNKFLTGALITAYNPFSQIQKEEVNKKAQDLLLKKLDMMSYSWLPAEGRGEDGEWDPEPSLYVCNITYEQACELAYEFSQNAFVWVDIDMAYPTLQIMIPYK